MTKTRLEAFSDGVLAIVITIMVLEMKAPHGASFADLRPLVPVFMSYVLSFIYVAIYWNNHHHMLNAIKSINGRIMWANMHLLFWLSLMPFATAWMGENHFSQNTMIVYGVVLLMSAIAYTLLSFQLIAHHGQDSLIGKAIGTDRKGKLSILIYLTAIAFSYVNNWIAFGLYVLVAFIWLIPDRRIESVLEKRR